MKKFFLGLELLFALLGITSCMATPKFSEVELPVPTATIEKELAECKVIQKMANFQYLENDYGGDYLPDQYVVYKNGDKTILISYALSPELLFGSQNYLIFSSSNTVTDVYFAYSVAQNRLLELGNLETQGVAETVQTLIDGGDAIISEIF